MTGPELPIAVTPEQALAHFAALPPDQPVGSFVNPLGCPIHHFLQTRYPLLKIAVISRRAFFLPRGKRWRTEAEQVLEFEGPYQWLYEWSHRLAGADDDQPFPTGHMFTAGEVLAVLEACLAVA